MSNRKPPSEPTIPAWTTRAPARAKASDWFNPLPPAKRVKLDAAIVSPGRTKSCTRYTRSMFNEPKFITFICCSSPAPAATQVKRYSPESAARIRSSCLPRTIRSQWISELLDENPNSVAISFLCMCLTKYILR